MRTIIKIQNRIAELTNNKDDEGATMVEYGLIVAAIALVVVLGAGIFGGDLSDFFVNLSDNL